MPLESPTFRDSGEYPRKLYSRGQTFKPEGAEGNVDQLRSVDAPLSERHMVRDLASEGVSITQEEMRRFTWIMPTGKRHTLRNG